MTKRKYRTDEEWLSLIQECRLSGLTDKQWCEAHQICPSNFRPSSACHRQNNPQKAKTCNSDVFDV